MARALIVVAETGGASLTVIPAQAGIQVVIPGFRVSLRSPGMTGCHTSGLGNGHVVSEQRSEESQRETLHFVQGDNPGAPIL